MHYIKNQFSLFCLLFVGLFVFAANAHSQPNASNAPSKPINHDIWDALLKKNVRDGWVDYKGFIRDSTEFNQYLHRLEASHPNDKNWSRNEQMAYWINAYNAFTIKLIIDHYPIKSIKDIKRGIPLVNTVWDIKFIKIEGKTYDLNQIEHQILRKNFKDARIHAAINCASYSCPALPAEAFTAEKLNTQLEDTMRKFINDPLRNQITAKSAKVSEIFNWFAGDFKRDAGSVRAFLNQYANKKIAKNTAIQFLDYQWTLNETK